MTDRKTDCADNTLSANPAGNSATLVMSALTPHQCVEIDPRRRSFLRLAVSPFDYRRTQRCNDLCFDRVSELSRLHHGIAQRDQPRLLPVAAQRVAEADLAGRQPHRGTRHRRLAEIERRTVPADAAAHHDEAVLGLAQVFMVRQRDRRETPFY